MSLPSTLFRSKTLRRWLRRALFVCVGIFGLGLVFHFGVLFVTHMQPPSLDVISGELSSANDDPSRRQIAGSYLRRRGRIREVRLLGKARTHAFHLGKLL